MHPYQYYFTFIINVPLIAFSLCDDFDKVIYEKLPPRMILKK